MIVNQLEALPDGQIVIAALLGANYWPSSLAAPEDCGLVGVFNPDKMSIFPAFQRFASKGWPEVAIDGYPGKIIITQQHSIMVTGGKVNLLPWLPSRQIVNQVNDLVIGYHRDIEKINAAYPRSQAQKMAALAKSMTMGLAAHLNNIASNPSASFDPKTEEAFTIAGTEMIRIAGEYDDLIRISKPLSTSGFFYKFLILEEQTTAILHRVREDMGETPLTPDGKRTWRPANRSDM